MKLDNPAKFAKVKRQCFTVQICVYNAEISLDRSKIVVYNFLFTSFFGIVQLLNKFLNVALDLLRYGTLQMLLLVRSEEHRVLLLWAEVENELHFRLLKFSTLNFYDFVWVSFLVHYRRRLLAQSRAILLVLYVNDLKLHCLGFFVILFVFGVCVQAWRGAFTTY